MNKITCEMCNGVDIVKDGDYYVCQSCGTKYTVEAAKKLMIEGPVTVKGTVIVDNSDFIQKSLENARRAYQKEDWAEVEKYYDLVEQNSSNNMEAVFFSAYGKAMLSLSDSEYYKREQKFNVLKNSISVINDYYELTTEDKIEVLQSITAAIIKMYSIKFVYNPRLKTGTGSYGWQIYLLFNSIKKAFIIELNQILSKHTDEYTQKSLQAMKSRLIPQKKAGACYVATCVYGSYDCPQVWTLRRYRDETLFKSLVGRAFIRTYYAISPFIVKHFGETQWFQNTCRGLLDKIVKKLNAKGVSDNPYNDTNY